MEKIKEALMKWGEAMQVRMDNRTLHYSPVLGHWRVKKWSGVDARSFLYDGESFEDAFQSLLGPNAEKLTETEKGKED